MTDPSPQDRSRPARRGEGPPSRGIERLTDLPVALAIRCAGAILARLGPGAAYRFSGGLAAAWWHLVPRRRRIALRNLEIAFRGTLPPAEAERIARESFFHAVATAADSFLRERWIRADGWRSTIELSPEVEGILSGPRPRGLCVLSAHLGDWEMLHYLFALRGAPGMAVVRRIHNPHLDRLATGLRSCHGGSVVPKDGALRVLRQTLAAGKVVGLLADQSAPPSEGYRPFFGAATATYGRYGGLLARARCDVRLILCLRQGRAFRFRMEARDLTPALEGPGDAQERGGRLVEAYLKALEGFIRAHPEQYLWMHRRWKHRPPGAPGLYGSLGSHLDPALLPGGSGGGPGAGGGGGP